MIFAKEFTGKNVIITGGSSDIGAATAEAFARKGANVIITYNTNVEAAEKVLEKLETYGVNAMAIAINMGSMTDVKRYARKLFSFLMVISMFWLIMLR